MAFAKIKSNFGDPELIAGVNASMVADVGIPSRHADADRVAELSANLTLAIDLPRSRVSGYKLAIPTTIPVEQPAAGASFEQQARSLLGLPLTILAATRAENPDMLGDSMIAHAHKAADEAREQLDHSMTEQVLCWRRADRARQLAIATSVATLSAVVSSVSAPIVAATIAGMAASKIAHHLNETTAGRLDPRISTQKVLYSRAVEATRVVTNITHTADNLVHATVISPF